MMHWFVLKVVLAMLLNYIGQKMRLIISQYSFQDGNIGLLSYLSFLFHQSNRIQQ